MRRKIVLFIIIAICFLLQTTVFRALTFANIGESADYCGVFFWTHAWKKRRAVGWILLWIAYRHIFGFYLGGYALLYMYIGYINGLFKKDFTRMILSFR